MKSKVATIIFAFVVLLAISYGIVIKFSAVETRFECKGKITLKPDAPQRTAIWIKVAEYRWWVGLWSDSNGDLKLEIPNKAYEYYSPLIEVGDQLQIYDGPRKASPSTLRGTFSKLSKALAIKTSVGFFDGTCKEQTDHQ